MSFLNKIYTKTICWMVSGAFFLTSVVNGYAYTAQLSAPEPVQFDIPFYLGQVVEEFDPAGQGPEIVLIKDLHVNYEVQKNIMNIISAIGENNEISEIGLEGDPSGKVIDTSLMSTINDIEVRDYLVDYFMKKGMVRGPEGYSVLNPAAPDLVGIENKELYDHNVDLMLSSLLGREEAVGYLERLVQVIRNYENRNYSSDLRRFRTQYFLYQRNEIEPEVFHRYLVQWADKNDIHIDEISSQYDRYIHASRKLARLDGGDLQKKYEDLIERVETEEEVYKDYREIFLSSDSLFEKLSEKINSDRHFSDLREYIRAIEMMKEINTDRIIEEERRVISEIANKLCRNEKEEDLLFAADYVQIMVKFLLNQISKDELDYFYEKACRFEEAITRLERAHGIDMSSVDSLLRVLAPYVEETGNFYSVALDRDEHFVKNFAGRASENDGLSIMVIGGFHSEGVKSALEEKEIPYSIVMPRVTSHTSRTIENYYRLLRGERILSYAEIADEMLAVQTFFPDADFITQVSMAKAIVIMNSYEDPFSEELLREIDYIFNEGWEGFPGQCEIIPDKSTNELYVQITVGRESIAVKYDGKSVVPLKEDGETFDVVLNHHIFREAERKMREMPRRGFEMLWRHSPAVLEVLTERSPLAVTDNPALIEHVENIRSEMGLEIQHVEAGGYYIVYSPKQVQTQIRESGLLRDIGTGESVEEFIRRSIEERSVSKIKVISGFEVVDMPGEYEEVMGKLSEERYESTGEMAAELERSYVEESVGFMPHTCRRFATAVIEKGRMDVSDMGSLEQIQRVGITIESAPETEYTEDRIRLETGLFSKLFLLERLLDMAEEEAEKEAEKKAEEKSRKNLEGALNDIALVVSLYAESSDAMDFKGKIAEKGISEAKAAAVTLFVNSILFTDLMAVSDEELELVLGVYMDLSEYRSLPVELKKEITTEVIEIRESLKGDKRIIKAVQSSPASDPDSDYDPDRPVGGIGNLTNVLEELAKTTISHAFISVALISSVYPGYETLGARAVDIFRVGSADETLVMIEYILNMYRDNTDGITPELPDVINIMYAL